MEDLEPNSYEFNSGKRFGKKCHIDDNLELKQTLEAAAKKVGFSFLPKDCFKWGQFVHGAEDGWISAQQLRA